ncbi:LysM peptidoglycan-binding domain-containing protein [Paenibacillus sacheonensis]|uniref:LysM peptidoglycan-binding domain-containing protein n=1 Tax=Paenibacillus sacheonensis TaxID=742054 RepID=A0A7X4YKW6_9BACL|nr:LysM domain-containing protein [Paenibacillus sacheonensis]MBM7563148.1 phage tail protein X [Paenibacillus sacheonensis]NBC68288.1 LysM peptidoglycan-binding domain-containing protein [Paenibacillus sacheonensis]
MNRGFFPGGGFGGGFGRPFFRPFGHPFFPGRFLFPTFFFSPFFFPFFRDDQAGDMVYAQHQVKPGDTMASICHTYNMPYPILEEANPHLADNKKPLQVGDTVTIPRISNMYCQKTYSEAPAGQTQQNAQK